MYITLRHSCASGVPIVRIALCKRPPISYVYFASVSVRLFSFTCWT